MENRDIMMGLKKLHVNSGHCSVDDMYRMLKLGKARTRALQLCNKFRCSECERHQAPKISRTVKPKSTTHFGEKLGFDVIEMQLSDGTKISGLNMLDVHTTFQVVWPMFKEAHLLTSEDLLVAYELRWAHLGATPGECTVRCRTSLSCAL